MTRISALFNYQSVRPVLLAMNIAAATVVIGDAAWDSVHDRQPNIGSVAAASLVLALSVNAIGRARKHSALKAESASPPGAPKP